MSTSRTIFDEVRCFDCKVIIPKDESTRITVYKNTSIAEETVWLCESCYADRMAKQQGYKSYGED